MVLTSNAVARLLCLWRNSTDGLRQLLTAKLLLIMKLTAILFLTACIAANAKGYAQQITLSEKDVPLQQVFEKIEKQSGYTFAYAINQLAAAKKVSINIVNGTIEEVLKICFQNQPFSYGIIEKTIVIKPKQEKINEPEIETAASSIDIKGKIVNENGEPVAASIIVKGTQQGATTNEKGEFELKAVDENATLIITGVNIDKFEVKLNGKRSVFYTAKTKVTGMQEVIVNKGYYTEKQKLSTSNVATITAKDIEKQPVQNVLLALQARVPGLFIIQNSGTAGSSVNIRIQGQNSIANGSDPLYVIDGVPIDAQLPRTGNDWMLGNAGPGGISGWGNPLNYLNPGDIESIDILKDADATAIYGSRAANGAILITTKRGKAGDIKFEVNMQTGIGSVARRVDMMNTRQYLDMRYEAFVNDGIDWRSPNVAANDLKLWDTTHYTNWQDALIGGISNYTNLSASLSGGSANVRYLVSGTYHKETTVFPLPDNFADQKGSVHFNINGASNDQKFRMQFSGNFMADNNQLPQADFTQTALLLEPNAPALLNADGSINWAPDANGNTTLSDANVMIQKFLKYVNRTYNLVSGLNLEYTILPGFKIGSSFGYNYMQTDDYSPAPLITVAPELRATKERSAAFGDRNIQSWIIEPQASYSTRINKGKLELLVGSTFQDKKAISRSVYGTGQLSDELLNNINASANVFTGLSSDSRYKYNAVFGRLNYNWSDKYILNFNARRDGSTRFGSDNRFHNFGSVGAAWVFFNEKFFSSNAKLGFVSFGKLRGSYGITGSDQIGDYRFMSLYNFNPSTSAPYQGIPALFPAGLPNPDLQWEETRKLQVGIDVGFKQDRIVLKATYVRNRSSNQLLDYVLPNTAGFTSYQANFPAVIQNRNWEFLVMGKVVQKENLNWTSSVNITIPQNKLVSFPNLSTSTYAGSLVVGEPVDVLISYHWAGVAEGTGDYLYTSRDGHLTLAPNSTIDRTSLNSRFPKLYGGFQNSITYKGIQLDFIFQFVNQTGVNDLTFSNGFFYRFPGMFAPGVSNQPVTVLDRWQKPGDKASAARFQTGQISSYIMDSDRRFADLSYISLRNLSLSWDLPQKWMDKMHCRNFRVYLHGQNLLTITKYKGLNPETQSMSSLPPLQVWMVGVQMGL